MRAAMRRFTPAVLAFVCLLCIAQALLYASEGKDKDSIRTLLLQEPYPAEDAVRILEAQWQRETEISHDIGAQNTDKEISQADTFAIWGERGEVRVASRKMNRSTEAVVITVCGNSRLVMESSRGIGEAVFEPDSRAHTLLSAQEREECLVSPALGAELFGHEDAVGQVLEAGDREYRAVGVLHCEEPAMLLSAAGNPGAELERVSVETKGLSVSEAMQRFESSTGIQGNLLPVHLCRLSAEMAARAVPAFLYILFGIQLVRAVKRCSRIPMPGSLAAFGTAIVLTAAGIWIFDIHVDIPRDMLPTMWSDFDFWSELWRKKTRELFLLIKTEKSQMELWFLHNFIKTAGFSFLSLVLGVFTYRRLKIKNMVIFWSMVASALLVTYFYLVLNMGNTAALIESRILWLLLPACFTMRALSQACICNTDTDK